MKFSIITIVSALWALAAVPMAVVIGVLYATLSHRWPSFWLYNGLTVAAVGGLGLAIYLGILYRLRLPEVRQLQSLVRTRLGM